MALPKYDLNQVHQPQIQKARFKHPDHGYMEYEPLTMRITGGARERISHPINLAGVKDSHGNGFIDTPQPYVQTCSQPVENVNAGCPKWAGCPFKGLPHVGPVALRIRHDDDVTSEMCYNVYETLDKAGRPISQNHMLMDGWTVDTDGTTHPVKSNVPLGKHPISGKLMTQSQVWEREIPNLGPPWWPQIKKKIAELLKLGEPVPRDLGLPRSAELYPELVGEDECGEKSPLAVSQPSVSPSGRGKRTRKARARAGTDSSKLPSAPES